MTLKKRIGAGIGALIIILSASGCAGRNEWVMKTENHSLSSGEYVFHILNQISNAYDITGLPTSEKIFEHEVEGQDAEEWVAEQSDFQARLHLAVNEKFDELGLSFSSYELEAIQADVDQNYESFVSFYGSAKGVSADTYYSVMEMSYKQSKIMAHIYGTGGEKEVPEDELKEYFSEHAAKYQVMSFTKYSDDDEANASTIETIEGYLERINGEDSEETFGDIYVEHYQSLNYSVEEASYSVFFDNDVMEEALRKGIFKTAEIGGDAIMIEANHYYYMVQRFDHMEDETEVSSYLNRAMASMKRDEFEESLVEYLEENFTLKKNESMLDKYQVLKVYSH